MNGVDIGLIAITILLFLRIWTPWGARTSGNLVRQENLSLFGRLRMHGWAAALIVLGMAIATIGGWTSGLSIAIVCALLVVLFALPVRYTLTSSGIRAGGTPFRRWTEFGGVTRRPGGVRLQGVAGARPHTVWLSGGREDDEFVLLLRQLVRGSYKGELGPAAGAPLAGAASGTVQIVGVGGS